jgi:hypothetical protein
MMYINRGLIKLLLWHFRLHSAVLLKANKIESTVQLSKC